jgi:hypothetical protein
MQKSDVEICIAEIRRELIGEIPDDIRNEIANYFLHKLQPAFVTPTPIKNN